MAHSRPILTLNSGSSSIKFALYAMGEEERLVVRGEAERIGQRDGLFWMTDAQGRSLARDRMPLPDHDAALGVLFQVLQPHVEQGLEAVGHRIVHGGARHTRPEWIDAALLAELTALIPLAPNHLPHEIRAIQAVQRLAPHLPQAACFDTAFHRQMPELAQVFPLPRRFWEEGIRRYGFHGLSYEYIAQELARIAPAEERRRVIVAHLGSGASMAALLYGQSVETTMGFTPTAGLVMSTRSGDIDPGLVLYLIQQKGMQPEEVADLLNHGAGLLGVSGISGDMEVLLDRRREDPQAALAVDLFCYQARKFIGALAAVLGGVDTLVFTAGIGERAAAVRWNICKGLEFLGIRLDPVRNDAHAPIISQDGSACTVRVIQTNEELMIARHTVALLEERTHP